MLLSNQIFNCTHYPVNHKNMKTSDLIKDFLVTFNDPAIPFFTPLGNIILTKIEDILRQEATNNQIDEVKIPLIMKTQLLEKGQQIGEQFAQKIVHLGGSMGEFHMMTSPEMMFLNLFSENKLTERTLPIHYFYCTDLCRNMPDPKGFLRGKQLRVFGGISFDKTQQQANQTSQKIDDMFASAFKNMGFPFHREAGGSGFSSEYFYLLSKENESYFIPSINPSGKTKALSFGMNYQYIPEKSKEGFFYIAQNGEKKLPYMTSYALSTQRILYVVMDYFRDEHGVNLPENLRPLDIIVLTGKETQQECQRIAQILEKAGYKVGIEDLYYADYKKRLLTADFLGTQYTLSLGKNTYLLRSRGGKDIIKSKVLSDVLKPLFQSKIDYHRSQISILQRRQQEILSR